MPDAGLDRDPHPRRASYLEVALASIAAPGAAARARSCSSSTTTEPAPRRARSPQRFGAALCGPPATARAERRHATRASSARDGELVVFVDDDVRAARGGWRRCSTRGARAPRRRRVHRPDPARLEGPAPRSCGREAAADHHARPRPRGHRRALRLGREHDDPPRARWSAWDRSTPSLEHGGDEQEWQDRLRAQRPGARVLYVAAAARRPPPRRRGRAPARAGGGRLRARSRRAALRRPRRARAVARARALTLAGCARARAAPALPRRADDGRPQRGTPARGPARASGAARGSPPARAAPDARDDFLSGTSGTVGGLDSLRRGRSTRPSTRWRSRAAGACGWRSRRAAAPALQRVLVLGVVRPENRALAQRIRARARGSRHDVRAAPAPRRARASSEPQRAARRASAAGQRLAAGRRRRRASCRAAFSTASCSCATASTCSSPSRPTACDSHAAWPQSPAGGRRASCARAASSRSAP